MDSGMRNQDPHGPSIGRPTDQPPLINNSFEERGSDEEKAFEEESKTFSLQLRENSTQRQEAESCSNRESSRKRKSRSRDSPRATAGASLGEERSVTLEKKTRKVPDAGHSSDCEETRDVCPRRAQRRRTGCSKRGRSRSPGVQPPPLRKCLVTSLRAMSEAIYQNTVRVQNQRVPSPLSWEQLSMLAEIRGRLCAQVQTVYAMATHAAYVFPAEMWLVPTPMPGPRSPAGNWEEAQSSS